MLGNLRAAQNQWDESFEYHQRAARHMRATVGERDFYTANITHKIAEHLIRLGWNEEAMRVLPPSPKLLNLSLISLSAMIQAALAI